MPPLPPARRSELRAKAHALSPVVMIGDKGLTDTVIAEVDRALKAHELIKVRAATDDREARTAWMAQICERLAALPVQVIGKILVIWRENPKEEKGTRPISAGKGAGKKAAGKGVRPPSTKTPIRTSRQRFPAPSIPRASEPRRRRPRTSR
jgi:putative YhbY family RNA-binding protein